MGVQLLSYECLIALAGKPHAHCITTGCAILLSGQVCMHTHTHTQWSGRQPPACIDAPPSMPLLKHIMNQVYNRAITKPEELNFYEPFSPEVSKQCLFWFRLEKYHRL